MIRLFTDGIEDVRKITYCYVCRQETGSSAINTNGVSVCPDCVKRIVRNYISDLIQEDEG